ncbi:MAG: class I SAM-dependent methyltransferase [Saprospiraceae bacterium]|nr:class I SAM-dependent methyltransferase [Candidatus Defluviibacterium haderslevense]
MNNSEQVREYYNKLWFSKGYNKRNIRHKKIFNNLILAGLGKSSKVLEVGCGYGLLSDLIINVVKDTGKFVGVDISDDSILYLNGKYSINSKINFYNADLKEYVFDQKFDFIIFPDVLEHIPIYEHEVIFKNLKNAVDSNTLVLINNPSPFIISHYEDTDKDKLQIIDQPLYINHFHFLAEILDFKILSVYQYSLYHSVHKF